VAATSVNQFPWVGDNVTDAVPDPERTSCPFTGALDCVSVKVWLAGAIVNAVGFATVSVTGTTTVAVVCEDKTGDTTTDAL
jgi:hypothetical protein